MGGLDKLTELVRGKALLRDRAQMMLEVGFDEVIVVLPPDRPFRHEALAGLDVRVIVNDAASSGMATSIVAGIAALPDRCGAALIMPADMPDLDVRDLKQICKANKARPERIMRASDQDGRAGSPVIFPRSYFKDLLALSLDESGRSVLARHSDQVDLIALPARHATCDLDTPEDWANWRALN
jgi:CTP:molybdopterin cytidylyltransferase MocA